MALRLIVSLLLSATVVVDASRATVTPIEKVTSLLKGLQAKITEEGKEEAAAYDKFACFCAEQAKEKQASIEKSNTKIAKLTTQIKDGNAKKAFLNTEISRLSKVLSKKNKEIADESADRAADHKNYLAKAKDLAESIGSTADAIQGMKGAQGGLSDAKINLIEMHSKLHATAMRIFGSGASYDFGEEEQNPAKYAFQGNGIIGNLEELLANFKKMKATLDSDEVDTQAAFESEALGDKNEANTFTDEKKEDEKLAAQEKEDVMGLEQSKDEEINDRDADAAFLETLTADCEEKAQVFDQRSKSRSDELTAMTGALTELEGKVKANEGANGKLVGLVQGEMVPSFIQETLQQKGNQAVKKAEELLQEAASNLDSSFLRGAAVRVQLSADHFDKVRGLINDLIKKLKDDAKAEASQKSMCDTGMTKAMAGRDKGQANKEKAEANVDSQTALSQELSEDIADLAAGIAANSKALNEAAELRESSKAANKEAIRGATEGKASVKLALKILSEFYSGAALVQLKSKKYTPPNADRDGKNLADLSPATASEEYKGAQTESKGIMGMLEVIQSDFARTISTVTDNEAIEAGAFTKLKKETDADTKAKTKTQENKEDDLAETKAEILDQKAALQDANKLLGSANDKLDDLKAACVEGEETWEERAAARKKEVEALKDAMSVLDQWKD